MYANHGGKKNRRPAPAAGRRRTEGHGNKAVNDGEARERVKGEKVGGRSGRLGSREGSLIVLVEWPFAKIYTRRGTEKCQKEPASTINKWEGVPGRHRHLPGGGNWK